jgi:hypothetical protein
MTFGLKLLLERFSTMLNATNILINKNFKLDSSGTTLQEIANDNFDDCERGVKRKPNNVDCAVAIKIK